MSKRTRREQRERGYTPQGGEVLFPIRHAHKRQRVADFFEGFVIGVITASAVIWVMGWLGWVG